MEKLTAGDHHGFLEPVDVGGRVGLNLALQFVIRVDLGELEERCINPRDPN